MLIGSARVSYRILSWGGGGGGEAGWWQGDSNAQNMCMPTRGVCGHAPPPSPEKILNLDLFRLLLTQSGTRLLFNTCDKTIITILNFKISGGGGGGGEEGNCGWRGENSKLPSPPLYET